MPRDLPESIPGQQDGEKCARSLAETLLQKCRKNRPETAHFGTQETSSEARQPLHAFPFQEMIAASSEKLRASCPNRPQSPVKSSLGRRIKRSI
jgi:hypothetical protein